MSQKKIDATPVTAAGGVVFRVNDSENQVLVIKRNGFWELPKGKLEKKEAVKECALREVEEETGLEGLKLQSFLCDTYHEYVEDGTKYGKTTYWYLMEAGRNEKDFLPQAEEGITNVEWVPLKKALDLVEFANLKNVLHETINRIS
ncbi:MAG: NUDIX hydrolase [Balneolaceae bacterium]|nr:NUDIX hydrolase [Balneolaceae bacterium]